MSAAAKSTQVERIARFLRFEIPEVWVRFLLAIVGLGLAFLAALFSTVTREAGSLWGTLVLASIALLLAVLVGLTTVPYLARRVATARLREAFDYDVTRVGIAYVVAILLIGIAALNTGNNLLYIIVAAMLAAILVSGIASAVVLRGLELDIRLPEHVFAGRTAAGRIVVRNKRRWLPSFSVSVVAIRKEAAKRWRWVPAKFGFPPKASPEKQWVHLPDRQLRRVADGKSDPGIFEGSVYFPYLAAGKEEKAELELCFPRRGVYRQEAFGLATRFPFSFLVKTRQIALSRKITVYPRVDPTDELFEVLPLLTGEFATFMRGRGSELYRIREYAPEDSARHVDWKATARSGSLKVREFTREDERKLRIVFDNPAAGALGEPSYEKAVNLAASLSWHFAGEGTELSFAAPGYEGGPDIYRFLGYLAAVVPEAAPSIIDKLRPSEDYNVIFTARPRGTIPTALWACSYFVFMGTD